MPGLLVSGLLAVLLSLVAMPAQAASCRTDEVTTTAVLAPGETTTTRRTVPLPEGEVVMTAAKPTFAGDLGPHLTVSLRWCAGQDCTPQSRLEPGAKARLTANSVTIEQSVTLAAAAPAAAMNGTVQSRVSLGSERCGTLIADMQSGSGGADGGDVLAFTGGSLTAAAWGIALSSVGLFCWIAGRSRRRAEP